MRQFLYLYFHTVWDGGGGAGGVGAKVLRYERTPCVKGHPEERRGRPTLLNSTACRLGAHLPLMWTEFRTEASTITFFFFPFLQMLFYRAPGSPLRGQPPSNPVENDTHSSAASNQPHFSSSGQVAPPEGQTTSKALGLRFNENNDLRKTHIRRHTTVANYKTYYLATRQARFLISADGRAHSCFRFVPFRSSCSESPFVMSVTEDKTNTY